MQMKNLEPNVDGRAQIHNVRFYKMKPRSIECMAYNKQSKKLALSRNDGTIEIWDTQYAAHVELVIPNTPGGSVEGLVWAGKRLFSVGITGELVEWDLQELSPRRLQMMTGNALWCIDVNPGGTDLAVGTEEGYVNLMSIENDELIYKNLFDRQEGRVLCCKFDATGNYLVTGSVGAIRIWNVQTGHAVNRMNVSSAENAEVIVWSIQVLSDFSIISGDSAGFVTIWDGYTATQVEALKVLNADVLAVTTNEKEDLLMCTGIEPLIRILARTQIKREEMIYKRWVKFLQRSVHEHDVKAMLCIGDNILSGGVDGYLTISSASKTRSDVVKYASFPKGSCVTHAPEMKFVLLRYSTFLELWRLGSVTPDLEQHKALVNADTVIRQNLPVGSMPEKLLMIKSINTQLIICAAISPNGKWICYSTHNDIHLFRYFGSNNLDPAALKRIVQLPPKFGPAIHLEFTTDSKRLFLIRAETKNLLIFRIIDDKCLEQVETIELAKHIKETPTHLKLSQCENYIVIASLDHTIAVWILTNDKNYKHLLNLPRYPAATTALALHNTQPRLVTAFADGRICEYDLEEKRFTVSSSMSHVLNTVNHCTNNIVLDDKNPNIFILQNDAFMFVVEKVDSKKPLHTNLLNNIEDNEQHVPLEEYDLRSSPRPKVIKKAKSSPTKASVSEIEVSTLRLKLQLNYEHLLHICRISPNELVAVGVDAATLIEQLPNAYRQKKFGVS